MSQLIPFRVKKGHVHVEPGAPALGEGQCGELPAEQIPRLLELEVIELLGGAAPDAEPKRTTNRRKHTGESDEGTSSTPDAA